MPRGANENLSAAGGEPGSQGSEFPCIRTPDRLPVQGNRMNVETANLWRIDRLHDAFLW